MNHRVRLDRLRDLISPTRSLAYIDLPDREGDPMPDGVWPPIEPLPPYPLDVIPRGWSDEDVARYEQTGVEP